MYVIKKSLVVVLTTLVLTTSAFAMDTNNDGKKKFQLLKDEFSRSGKSFATNGESGTWSFAEYEKEFGTNPSYLYLLPEKMAETYFLMNLQ